MPANGEFRQDPTGPPSGGGNVSRRRLVGAGIATAAGIATSQLPSVRAAAGSRFSDNPFSLGVASGDPLPHAVVIWTRIAPDPLNDVERSALASLRVHWKVATDRRMRNVVRHGTATAHRRYAHSVHVDVHGLEPDTEYFYRFRADGIDSALGTTRTAPAHGTALSRLRFAFGSCQNYSDGHYNAHAALAEEDLNFVVWLGDYIYDGPGHDKVGRPHLPEKWLASLADYRTRYALYKSDPDLQAAHQALPWVVMLDNHDVTLHYAGFADNPDKDGNVDHTPAEIKQLRTNAFRAAWEHLPLRCPAPQSASLKLYRNYRYGDLATLNMLDLRQYSDVQADDDCAVSEKEAGYCPDLRDPARSVLGDDQMKWLLKNLARSETTWDVLGNPFRFAQHDKNNDPEQVPDHRKFGHPWDHFVADRQKVIDRIVGTGKASTVLVTGDHHLNWVEDVPPDIYHWDADPVATEFLGTSITSGGDRPDKPDEYYVDGATHPTNPQLRFRNYQHGYATCTLTPDRWQTDYRVVDTVEGASPTASTLCTWSVEPGHPGAQLVSRK